MVLTAKSSPACSNGGPLGDLRRPIGTMHVERVRVRSFGRLQDLDTGSEPLGELVVVQGPNEGGKTTLFHFLTTILYGFYPASREAHPYAPWSGTEPGGSALLRLADGTLCEVHRRLLSSPSGTLERAGTTEDLRNRTLSHAEHVPLAVFRQVFAISLSDLGALGGESWARVQDQLVAGLGTADLRPIRVVVEELEKEAGRLWRPHRRGNQVVRNLRERLREVEARRREVAQADQTLREKVRERERLLAELDQARAEREADYVYIERFQALVPIRAALARARSLAEAAGPQSELATFPADPAERSAELDARAKEQEDRITEVTGDADLPRRRAQGLGEGDLVLLEARQDVEKVAALAQAAGWTRARADQLELELRELHGRIEGASADLFDAPLHSIENDGVEALPAGELRIRARDLEEARTHLATQREAERRLAESARDAPVGWARGRAAVAAISGVTLLIAGLQGDRTLLALAGALLLGAGAVLLVMAVRIRRPLEASSTVDADAVAREAVAGKAVLDLMNGLPVRESLFRRSPVQLADAVERLQHLFRDLRTRQGESTALRRDDAALGEELSRLAALCGVEIPEEPVAAAHLLTSATADASRRQASSERAREEVARLERTLVREEKGLAKVLGEAASLRESLASLGDGDEAEGLRIFRTRTEAAAQAARILGDLESAHPDLEDISARIHKAEEDGEEWVVDEEALARRRVRLPQMDERVEALSRREAALEQDIEYLSAGETLDGIDGEREAIGEQLQRLERERDRKYVLGRLLQEADRRFREQHQPELLRRAGEYLAAITDQRYARLLLSDTEGEISFKLSHDEAPYPVAVTAPLSTGTREQVYLALRLAAVDQLDDGEERLPLFLDETLVNWDHARRDRALALLASVAKDRQVFVFTCHPEAAQALAAQGARMVVLDPPG